MSEHHEPDDTWATRFLRKLATSVYGHRRFWLYPQILLFGLSVYYTITHLQFSTNRADLVGAEKRYHHNFQKFKEIGLEFE